MKKNIVLLITCSLLLIIMSSCVQRDETVNISSTLSFTASQNFDSNNDTNSVDRKKIYLVQDTRENIISISLAIPEEADNEQIYLVETVVKERINKYSGATFDLTLSKEDISDKSRDYSNYYIVGESRVSYISDDIVSIVFEIFYNKKGTAHPLHWFFTVNYNPNTLQLIKFSDKYLVNSQLYSVFSDLAENNIMKLHGGHWPSEWEGFSEMFCSEEEFIEGLINEEEFYAFYTEDGVGISYPVPHAVGDHMEVIIPYFNLTEVNQGTAPHLT